MSLFKGVKDRSLIEIQFGDEFYDVKLKNCNIVGMLCGARYNFESDLLINV